MKVWRRPSLLFQEKEKQVSEPDDNISLAIAQHAPHLRARHLNIIDEPVCASLARCFLIAPRGVAQCHEDKALPRMSSLDFTIMPMSTMSKRHLGSMPCTPVHMREKKNTAGRQQRRYRRKIIAANEFAAAAEDIGRYLPDCRHIFTGNNRH